MPKGTVMQLETIMMKLTVAALAALGVVSWPALAAEDSGFYVGVGIGEASIESDRVTLDEDLSFKFDASDTAFKIFGGWRLNPYIAFELDYADLGTATDKFRFSDTTTDITVNADISVTAWVPYVVGTWPIGIFELSAKAGYAFWDADFKASASGVPSEKGNDSGEDFAYGIGAGVTFLQHFNAKLEYEVMDVSDADVTAWWITGAWRF
jgi:OOP family OmpA-OmpF porin